MNYLKNRLAVLNIKMAQALEANSEADIMEVANAIANEVNTQAEQQKRTDKLEEGFCSWAKDLFAMGATPADLKVLIGMAADEYFDK